RTLNPELSTPSRRTFPVSEVICHFGRDPCGAEIEDENAVLVDVGVLETHGLRQVDTKLLCRSVCPYKAATVAAAFAQGKRISHLQCCRLQPDTVVCRVKQHFDRLGLAQAFVCNAAHYYRALRVHGHIHCCPLAPYVVS